MLGERLAILVLCMSVEGADRDEAGCGVWGRCGGTSKILKSGNERDGTGFKDRVIGIFAYEGLWDMCGDMLALLDRCTALYLLIL